MVKPSTESGSKHNSCKLFVRQIGLQIHMALTDKRMVYLILNFISELIQDVFYVGFLFWVSMHVHSMHSNGMNPMKLTHESASGATIYICYFSMAITSLIVYLYFFIMHEYEDKSTHTGYKEAVKNSETKYIRIFNSLIYPVGIPFIDGLLSYGLLTYWFNPHNHDEDGGHPFPESFMYIILTLAIILNVISIIIRSFISLPGWRCSHK